MKERECVAKHGHETVGGITPGKRWASCQISQEAVDLARRDDNEIERILIEKIKQAEEALKRAAIKEYFEKQDE